MCSLGGGSKTTTADPKWFGAFGEGSNIPGQTQRDSFYAPNMSAYLQAQANTPNLVNALKSGANNGGWKEAEGLARSQIRGDYLEGSPQLSKQISQIQGRAERGAANQSADIRSAMSRAGVGFSTANQQAQQASGAAARASAADTASNVMAENYGRERAIQQSSPQMLDTALSSPVNYLGQLNSAYFDPLNKASDLTMKLSGNGSLATPNISVQQKPGAIDYFTSILGAI